jgi:hypothetical protein
VQKIATATAFADRFNKPISSSSSRADPEDNYNFRIITTGDDLKRWTMMTTTMTKFHNDYNEGVRKFQVIEEDPPPILEAPLVNLIPRNSDDDSTA